MPFRKEPDVVPAFEPREKLFQVLKSSVQWGDLQNIETVGALNDMVTKYDMREIVLVAGGLSGTADRTDRRADCREAGNKAGDDRRTVFIRKNNVFAQALHSASDAGNETASDCSGQLFCGSGKTPRDEDDNYNFECLEAIDIEQFNKDMQALFSRRGGASSNL